MANSELNELIKAMELECSEVEPCRQKADYTIKKETIDSEVNVLLKEFKTFAAVPGFRKGKAPAALIKNRFMPQIKEELMKRFYMAAFDKMTEVKKLEIISYTMPEGEQPELELDKDFCFTINFDVEPEFEVPEYKGLKIDSPNVGVTDEELEERLNYFKDMYSEHKTIDGPAESGDMLKVSYTSDFELPENASPSLNRQANSTENWIWLNDPEVIPGCVKALTGAKSGEEYELEAEYPADYREAELAGKKANYKVNVVEVQRKTPLKSDEELCKKMQSESIDAIKEQIKKALTSEKEKANRQELGNKIYEMIEKEIKEFPFPSSLISAEANKELRNVANQTVKTEEDAEKFKEEKDKHMEQAEKSAKEKMRRMMIMKKIAKAENITVENDEVDRQIKGMSGYYGMKENKLRKMMEDSGSIQDMHLDIMGGKVIEFLIDNAKIVEAKAKKTEAKKEKKQD